MPSAPASVTDADLSGIWTLSKTLSDDTEPLFILQGIGYLLRKAAKIGKVSLKIEHASAATPPTLTMTIIPPGGFKGATNVRRLDGEPEQERNFMFGQISMTYRVKKKGDVTGYHAEEEWIGENILEEIIESTGAGWINTGTWGLVDLDGSTYLAKRSSVETKSGKNAKARMIYEYTGSAK